MITMKLEAAIALATRAHEGQTDKAGAPYIKHPLRMMRAVEGSDAKMVAVMHDLLEDTFVTAQYLEEAGYPAHIIAAVEAVTKRDDEHGDAGYEKFIRRAAQNPLARQVKIADLRDNMNLSRISQPTEKDFERILRYEQSLEYLINFSNQESRT